jgi:DNA-binding PadR family transcriptional regulator
MENPRDEKFFKQVSQSFREESADLIKSIENPEAPAWAIEMARQFARRFKRIRVSEAEGSLLLLYAVSKRPSTAAELLDWLDEKNVAIQGISNVAIIQYLDHMENVGYLVKDLVTEHDCEIANYRISSEGRMLLDHISYSKEISHLKFLGLIPSAV